MHGLSLIVLFLSIVVVAVVAFRLLHLPPVLGYLSVGVLIGPHALQLLPSSTEVGHLAELGIVFLMFTIGLEFSLQKLQSMRRLVLGMGTAQVIGTMIFFSLMGWALNHILPASLIMSPASWLALGGVLAMSSTAIVMKLLAERSELEAVHGRNIFGVLLFQDLAVVPLLILIPKLGQADDGIASLMAWGLFKTFIILALLLKLGHKPMHLWLTLVARRRSSELFMLNLFLMTLAFAWLTDIAGLSLALGAFIAGMLISETEYKHKVEEDIQPFKDILLGLFFIAMGMQLDISTLYHHWAGVLIVLISLLLIKFGIIAALAYAFGNSTGNAVRTALALAPAGEFGLVLLNLALGNQLLNPTIGQWVLAAIILSMFLTPFIIQYADQLIYRFAKSEWLLQSMQLTDIASHSLETQNHIIIAGFGRSGRSLARLLQGQHLNYIGIDIDPENVQNLQRQGYQVVYGDLNHKETLIAAGAMRAAALVIAQSDTRMALNILHLIRDINPELPVIVRTLDEHALEALQQAGAVAVVPEILEGSLVLASQTLLAAGTPAADVLEFIAQQRLQRYDLLRQHYDIPTAHTEPHTETQTHGHNLPTEPQVHTQTVILSDDSLWTDQTLGSLPTVPWRVQVINILRDDTPLELNEEIILRLNDQLEFAGNPDDTQHAALALNGQI